MLAAILKTPGRIAQRDLIGSHIKGLLHTDAAEGDPQLRDQLPADIDGSNAFRPAHPLVAGDDIEVTAHVLYINLRISRRLGTVQSSKHTVFPGNPAQVLGGHFGTDGMEHMG